MIAQRRGRPAIDQPVRCVVCIRLTDAEKSDLARIALENGQALTTFIRQAIAEAVADCTDEQILSTR